MKTAIILCAVLAWCCLIVDMALTVWNLLAGDFQGALEPALMMVADLAVALYYGHLAEKEDDDEDDDQDLDGREEEEETGTLAPPPIQPLPTLYWGGAW